MCLLSQVGGGSKEVVSSRLYTHPIFHPGGIFICPRIFNRASVNLHDFV